MTDKRAIGRNTEYFLTLDPDFLHRVRRSFMYNVVTGEMSWKIPRQGTKGVGSLAGHSKDGSPIQIRFEGRLFAAHRLAWLIHYGEWPDGELDHREHVTGSHYDNRLCNLRVCTRSQNQMNQTLRSDNTSGVRGVTLIKSTNKWRVRIRYDNASKHIGVYDNFEEAVNARHEAVDLYHREFGMK